MFVCDERFVGLSKPVMLKSKAWFGALKAEINNGTDTCCERSTGVAHRNFDRRMYSGGKEAFFEFLARLDIGDFLTRDFPDSCKR